MILEIRSNTPIPVKAYAEIAKVAEQLEHLADALGRPPALTDEGQNGSGD